MWPIRWIPQWTRVTAPRVVSPAVAVIQLAPLETLPPQSKAVIQAFPPNEATWGAVHVGFSFTSKDVKHPGQLVFSVWDRSDDGDPFPIYQIGDKRILMDDARHLKTVFAPETGELVAAEIAYNDPEKGQRQYGDLQPITQPEALAIAHHYLNELRVAEYATRFTNDDKRHKENRQLQHEQMVARSKQFAEAERLKPSPSS